MSGLVIKRNVAPAKGVAMMVALLVAITCACAVGLAISPQTAFAQDEDATLTLVVKHEENGTNKNIAGAEFTAYQVAAIGEGGKYVLVSPFEGESVDFNGTLTAEQSKQAAKSMAAIAASKKPAGKKATTDSSGQAAFGTLDMGVYLVVQTGAKDAAEGYNTMDPCLINVPQFNGSETTYDVVASMKPEPKKETNPDSKKDQKKETTSKTSSSPKTGDALDWNVIWLAAGVGLLAMAVALFAARKRRGQK